LRILASATDSTRLTLGTDTSGTPNPGSSTVIYKFTAAAGQRLYYDALQRDGDSINVHLAGPNGNVTGEFDNNSDFGPITLSTTGEYYLVLRGRQAAASDYRFRLIDASSAPALPLNTTVQDALNPGLGAVIYRLNGAAGQTFLFDGQPPIFDSSDG